MAREENFKTVSFGGYDKVAVDRYIDDLEKKHMQDIHDLKQTISKLSETVKSLQLVKDSMSSENNQAIENMQKYNESLQQELEKANRKLAEQEEQSKDYSSKMEAISKTLVETNERCAAMKREAEEESEKLRALAQEEYQQSVEKTESECQKMLEEAKEEKEKMLSEAREKVSATRDSIKRECESVSNYMASLMEAADGIVKACNETKVISDKVFGSISKQPADTASVDSEEEEIPQIKFQK